MAPTTVPSTDPNVLDVEVMVPKAINQRVTESMTFGPVAPGVHEKVQAKVLPLEMVTVLGQLIGS